MGILSKQEVGQRTRWIKKRDQADRAMVKTSRRKIGHWRRAWIRFDDLMIGQEVKFLQRNMNQR